MNWLVIPIEDLKQFDSNWKTRRMNVAGTEAIIHEEIYNELVPQTFNMEQDTEYPFTLLDQQGTTDLMNTAEWADNLTE